MAGGISSCIWEPERLWRSQGGVHVGVGGAHGGELLTAVTHAHTSWGSSAAGHRAPPKLTHSGELKRWYFSLVPGALGTAQVLT